MPASPEITLHAFQPADQAAVKDLILAGLVEHWGTLDPNKNPDLDDIAATYAGAVFLVARHLDRIIGTGALINRPNGAAEVVRMSVAADWRRQGIGTRLLRAALVEAYRRGATRATLEVRENNRAARAMYEKHGFVMVAQRFIAGYFTYRLLKDRLRAGPLASLCAGLVYALFAQGALNGPGHNVVVFDNQDVNGFHIRSPVVGLQSVRQQAQSLPQEKSRRLWREV